MADRIGVVSCGTMHQWGTPHEVYHRPATVTVAGFVGEGTFIGGRVGGGTLRCGLGEFRVRDEADAAGVQVRVRPEDVVHDDASPFKAEITSRTFRGSSILYSLRLDTGDTVLAQVPSHHDHAVGERLGIRADLEDVIVFPATAEPEACAFPEN